MAGKTTSKKSVFVLMPFASKYDEVYKNGIKEACLQLRLNCTRVDEQIFYEGILQRIYNQIRNADFIVADMSERNPNVFYETGFAHALSKKVILLTHDEKDIPFDLTHYRHIVYKGDIDYLKRNIYRDLVMGYRTIKK